MNNKKNSWRIFRREFKYIPSRKRVIRTRLKRHNFGIFWFVIFVRRQPYCIFRTKICSKFYLFQVAEFWESGFLVAQGKNAGNPVGLPSILTQRKRKSASQNRGSDYFLSANVKGTFTLICPHLHIMHTNAKCFGII